MKIQHITPILNVTDLAASFEWFEKWGWKKAWEWGSPPSFGAVANGHHDLFLCLDGQGGRGRGDNTTTFTTAGDEQADKGAWVCISVDDVDAVHRDCLAAGLEITFPPEDMPWNFREMHVRHPDGHVFRVGTPREED